MLLPVFRDLVRPQWRFLLEELKRDGGLPVSELAARAGASYMAVKAHCEGLHKAGYLIRTRVPRAEIGRPEIFYSLADKADSLFPQVGGEFALGLLDTARRMFGDTAPDKLLFQHYQERFESLAGTLDRIDGLPGKLARLADLRREEGCASRAEEEPPRLVEYHNPMQRVFDAYPRAVAMELNMIRQLLERDVRRVEIPAGREGMPRVVFEIA